MKPTLLLTTLLGCAGMFSVAHAGGLNPSNVSADAKWLLHYDADAARSSEIGEWMIEKLSDVDRRRIRAVERLLSIDPLEGVKSVTLYGTSPRPEDAILVVRVDHEADHVADLIAAAPHYKSKSAGNQVIHQIECGHGHSANIILVDDAYLIAAGTEGAVRRGAALVGGKGKSMKGSPEAASLGKGSPIFTAWANLDKLEMRSRSKMAKEVKSMRYVLGEKGDKIGWFLSLEMRGADTAKMVQKMAEGMLEYAKKDKRAEHPLMQDALAAIDSKVDGSTVHMWAAYDSGDVIKVLAEMEKKMKAYKASGKRGCPLGYGRGGSKDWGRGKGGSDKCPEGCDKSKPDCKGGCDKGGSAKGGEAKKCPAACEKGAAAKPAGKCPKCGKEGCKGCGKPDGPKSKAGEKGGDQKAGERGPSHRGHHHRHGRDRDDDDDDDDDDRRHGKPNRRT